MAEQKVFDGLKDLKAEQLIEIAELSDSKQFLVALRNAIVSATGWTFKHNSESGQILLTELNQLGKKFSDLVDKTLQEKDSVLYELLKEGYLEDRIVEVEKLRLAMIEVQQLQEKQELNDAPTTEHLPTG